MRKLEDFTDEELETTCNILQAVDIESENFFNSECSDAIRDLKLSESDISDMTQEFNETTAPQILLMDSCGYRVLLSTFVNLLIATNRKDIAMKIMEYRMKEEDE
jgi:hypothetical protein